MDQKSIQMRKIFNISLLFSLVLLFACTERIDLELENGDTKLVVEAFLTDQPDGRIVHITKTAAYYASGQTPAVEGAVVSLVSEDDQWSLTEVAPGEYSLPDNFSAIAGVKYRLNIQLKDPIGGYTDYTAVTKVPQPISVDSVKLEYDPDAFKGSYKFMWYMQDSPDSNNYLIKAYRNGKPLTDSLSTWSAFEDRFFNGKYTNGLVVMWLFERQGIKINKGDTLRVETGAITKGFTEYVGFMQQQLAPQNPLFSPPPANVKGNISHGALGYFVIYPVVSNFTIYQ